MSMISPFFHRNVEYFLLIARLQNMTEAARQIGMTQTSLSLAIQNLEDSLGYPVFERGRRGVKMTDKGLKLHLGLTKITSLAEELQSSVSETQSENCVKIGAIEHIGCDYLYSLLKQHRTLFPKFQLYMTYSKNIYEAVEQGKLTFGLVGWTSRPKTLQYIPIALEPLAIVGLKSKFSEISKAKKFEDLRDYPWVQLPKPQLDWTQLFLKDQEAYMVGGLYGQRVAILSGMGIGEVHTRVFSKAERMRLATARVSSPFAGTQIYCVYRPDTPQIVVERIMKLADLLQRIL
jgi:DNA-binding transcriptional LysR family regulator